MSYSTSQIIISLKWNFPLGKSFHFSFFQFLNTVTTGSDLWLFWLNRHWWYGERVSKQLFPSSRHNTSIHLGSWLCWPDEWKSPLTLRATAVENATLLTQQGPKNKRLNEHQLPETETALIIDGEEALRSPTSQWTARLHQTVLLLHYQYSTPRSCDH